ncbi:hypothetical protein BSKO_11933 [Bryopsis sp. KO-2023]|nr:hypothetical protein BSKO_11933 [Bryopsis sp. KO-2023]
MCSPAVEPSGKNAINVHCVFPAPRDLLLVMLSREIILFDIEFGQPVSSFRLPLTHRPFLRILSTSGRGVSAGGGIEGGIDVIHCLHEDGKVTAWSRTPQKLSYTCTSTFDLIPQTIRTPNGSTAKTSIENTPTPPSHSLLLPDPSLLVLTIMNNAQVWQWNLPLTSPVAAPHTEQLETPLYSGKSEVSGVKFVEVSEGEAGSMDDGKRGGLGAGFLSTPKDFGAPSPAPSAVSSFRCSSCNWGPTLLRVLTTLPSAVTTLAILPKPLLRSALPRSRTPNRKSQDSEQTSKEMPPRASIDAPETDMETSQTSGPAVANPETDMEPSQASDSGLAAENSGVSSDLDLCGTSPFKLAIDTAQDYPAVFDLMSQNPAPPARQESLQEEVETSTSTPVMAVVTSSGTLEIVPVNRGCVTAISLEITRSFALHSERSRSVRWLGCSPLVVSFCTEKTQHGWKNSLLVIDVRTGESAPFRELGSENAVMIGIRTSPSGRYILIVMKESPAEIWMVSGLRHVRRARHVDIPFTAVEWAVPEGPPFDPISLEYWQEWGCGAEWEEGVCVTDFPPETFVFAAKDGKVGAFTIKGKKVMDYKIRKAMWGVLSGGNSSGTKCSAVAALGSLVMFGDVEGNLTQWDMTSGKSTTVATDCGAMRKILMTPVRNSVIKVRLAIHSASWRCSIWEIDNNGHLTQTGFHNPNRFPDVCWIPNPTSTPYTTLLATVGEEGSLAILDIDNAGAIPSDGQSTPPGSPEIPNLMSMDGVLGGEPWVSLSLLLPNPLRLLLRLILQVGTPLSVLEHAVGLDSSVSDEEMEKEIWNRLPGNLNALSWGQPRVPPPQPRQSGLAPLMEEPSLRGGVREDVEVSGEWVSVSDKESIPSCSFEQGRPPPPSLDASLMRKSRNLSLASEVLASYEAAESRKKRY